MSVIRTFTVTVVSTDSGNRYFIDGVQQLTLNLAEGYTYIFDQSDNSNNNHPYRFSTTSNGTHGGGSEYTTGVTTNGVPGQAGAFTQIAVAASAPQLYYYCTNHANMGGQANTVDSNSWGVLQWDQNSWGDQDGIDLTLTGLSSTTTLGNLIEAGSTAGWGSDSWGDNNWGENEITVSLTGLTAQTTVGTFPYAQAADGWGRDSWGQNSWGEDGITVSLAGLGLTATTSLPSMGWGDQVFGSDNEGWGGIYQLPVADVMGLTGLGLQSAVGTTTTKSDTTFTLTGIGLQSTVGLVETDDHSVGLTGLSAQTALGTATPVVETIVALTGLGLQSSTTAITISSNPIQLLTGLSAEITLGGLTIDSVIVGLSGLSSSTALGAITTTQATVANLNGLGLTATTTLNDAINLKYFNRLVPKDSTGYSRKVPKNSTGYTRKVAN